MAVDITTCQSQQSPPRTKSLPASSTVFTPEDQMLHRDPTLHCVGRRHALCELPTAVGHSSTPRGGRHAHCKGAPLSNFSRAKHREPNISFTWAYCVFLRHWGDQTHCTFTPLIEGFGHHPKRLVY